MNADDQEFEPIPGLPTELPEGEEIVWQGAPEWKAMARHVFKIRWVAFYFGILTVARAGLAVFEGQGLQGLFDVLSMLGVFAAGLGLIAALAWFHARATLYTITTERVVMRIGVALSMSWNLPFKRLAAADLGVHEGGSGDVVLRLNPGERVRWALFWPHVQPARWLNARPAMRALPEPTEAGERLAEAVSRWAAGRSGLSVVTEDGEAEAPRSARPVLGDLAASG